MKKNSINEHKNPKNPFKPAFAGLKNLILTERNFQTHLIFVVLVIAACIFFKVTAYEWIAVLTMIGLVLGAEALNTAIEYICDHVCPETHPHIKKTKDISAAAVLVCTIIAVIVGCIIFIPYILRALGLI
jgi:Diacylglycerol kinase